MRVTQARLLGDSRGTDARARLAQAASRTEFLLRLSRTLAAIQNPERALAALVDLLLDELVDVVQVAVRTSAWQLGCGGVHGLPHHASVDRWAHGAAPHVDDAIARGIPDELVLPEDPRRRAATLASYLPPELAAEAADTATGRLMVLPLTARGRTFGLLILGRGHGFGDVATFLEDLAGRTAMGLDAALLLAESRHVATVLRRALSPAVLPTLPHLELATYYRVAHQSEELGGDLVDVHGPADDLVLLCGDVAGKGVEAAVQGKRIRNAVRTAAHVDRSPGWILGLVNRVLCAEADAFSESMATAVCARLRTDDDVLRVDLASAGHPPALVLRADCTLEVVPSSGVSLALLDDSAYDDHRLDLRPGDTLLIHTDGVTEARGALELFGDDRLHAVVAPLGGMPPAALVEAVAVAVSEHTGDRSHDDIALLAVRFHPDQP